MATRRKDWHEVTSQKKLDELLASAGPIKAKRRPKSSTPQTRKIKPLK